MQPPRTNRSVQAWVPGLLRDPATLLPIVLIVAFGFRAVWLGSPPGTLIFDEAYYVNAARILLGWAVDPGAPYAGATAGLDPNIEHPPLGKLIIAASMVLVGDNGIGWRVPSLIAGMVSLGAMYALVRAAGETAFFAILVVFLLALDNLMVVHSRLGTLDMLVLAPILVAAWLALRERWIVAGALLGLGFLVKITAIFGLLALLIVLALRIVAGRHDRTVVRSLVGRAVAVVGVAATVAIAGLWLLDARFTTFATPLDHLQHMIQYGSSLTTAADRGGNCIGIDSAPWQWPFNTCQINYLTVRTNLYDSAGAVAGTTPAIDIRGALNPLLASAMPLAALMVAWRAWTTRDRLSIWAVAWIAANYLPFVVLVLVTNRVTYLYYFLPVIPAAGVAVALLLLRSGLPRVVTWAYLVAYVLGFAAYFPFRQIP